ncbi:MAG TPA: hypothetical protein VJN62_10700 [Gemmatimonadales bacterium]|nr:hypothetical protein [Gemmatimonadales bacterium]
MSGRAGVLEYNAKPELPDGWLVRGVEQLLESMHRYADEEEVVRSAIAEYSGEWPRRISWKRKPA